MRVKREIGLVVMDDKFRSTTNGWKQTNSYMPICLFSISQRVAGRDMHVRIN